MIDILIQDQIKRKNTKSLVNYVITNSRYLTKADLDATYEYLIKYGCLNDKCKFAFNVGEPYITELVSLVLHESEPYELYTIIRYFQKTSNESHALYQNTILKLISTGSTEFNFKLLINVKDIPVDKVVEVILKSDNVDKIYNAMINVKGNEKLRLLNRLRELDDRQKIMKAIFEVHGIPVMALVKEINMLLSERLFAIRQWFMKDNYDKLAFYGEVILDTVGNHENIDIKYMSYCEKQDDLEKTEQIETLRQVSKTYKEIK